MASWITHLRIADLLYDKIRGLSLEDFSVGNIAPDSGEIKPGEWHPTPSKTITHWELPEKGNFGHPIRYSDFFEEYLSKPQDKKAFSFYLGYYSHLLTDHEWKRAVLCPLRDRYMSSFPDKYAFYAAVKPEWYRIDLLYLKSNPSLKTYNALKNLKSYPNVYLDYFSEKAVEIRAKSIPEFYESLDEGTAEFVYFTPKEADEFVKSASEHIFLDITDRL